MLFGDYDTTKLLYELRGDEFSEIKYWIKFTIEHTLLIAAILLLCLI